MKSLAVNGVRGGGASLVPAEASARCKVVRRVATASLPPRKEDLVASDTDAHSVDVRRVLQVAIVSTAVYTIAGGLMPARAEERVWKPRRHYRRMGERITDTWADEAVAVEEQQVEDQIAKQMYLKEFRKKQQEDELKKIKAAEQARVEKAAKMLAQQDASSNQYPFVVKVGGVDIFPYIFWGAIGTAALYASRAMFNAADKNKKSGGRWVYDRSLGGKKVWVPDSAMEANLQSAGRVSVRAEEFDRLVSIAAARNQAEKPQEFKLPKWWNPAVTSFAPPDVKAAKQVEADKLLARIEQAKNRGEDYSMFDILQLRKICQEGGVTVRPKTVGARDAIFMTAVDTAVMYAQDRTNQEMSLGDQDSDCPETRLLSALAADLNLAEDRAVSMVRHEVAAACRARLLDAVKHLKENNEMDALVALMYLSSLIQNLPVLDESCFEPELISQSLEGSASMEERQKIFYVLGQLNANLAPLFAGLLGFDAKVVVPKLFADVDAYKSYMQNN